MFDTDPYVSVLDFPGTDTEKVQKAIQFASLKENPSTVYVPKGDYVITSTIVLEEGVHLIFAYDARFVIYGNKDVIQVERNASITGAYIAIDDSSFNSSVLVFNGKYHYYNSWNRSVFKQINIVNWSNSHKGKGIYLYAGGPGHEISFLQFDDVKLVGLHTALEIRVNKPSNGYSWVNANTFNGMTIDDCVRGIWMNSSKTIPNEASGNNFTNLQIQLTPSSQSAVRVAGEYNAFNGVVWDPQVVSNPTPLLNLTPNSQKTDFYIRSNQDVKDDGTANRYY
ncbi:glycoside hydrolase family 55 protein [Halobacillus litoralis]|uniref:glycoside hydrolase family 55 protein n=1 Tax=Halobacillus litoralis TaxID=45668 RepID=UPI001CFDAFF6|nr:glycoside hydrolase family 55 protein [Halobacillus litoralis]